MENDKRTKISPKTGRGLGHVTLLFLAVRSAILATAWLLVNKDYVLRHGRVQFVLPFKLHKFLFKNIIKIVATGYQMGLVRLKWDMC